MCKLRLSSGELFNSRDLWKISSKWVYRTAQQLAIILKCRQDWLDDQPDHDPRYLGFIDETNLSAKMYRLCRCALRGERCRTGAPRPLENYDFIAGLPLTGMTTPFVHEGVTNGDIFHAYVEHVFVPMLSPGDIVVLNNLPAHKVSGAQKAIEQVEVRMTVPRVDGSGLLHLRMLGAGGGGQDQWMQGKGFQYLSLQL